VCLPQPPDHPTPGWHSNTQHSPCDVGQCRNHMMGPWTPCGAMDTMWDHVGPWTPCGAMDTMWDHVGPCGTMDTMWDHGHHVGPCGTMDTMWDHVGPCGTMDTMWGRVLQPSVHIWWALWHQCLHGDAVVGKERNYCCLSTLKCMYFKESPSWCTLKGTVPTTVCMYIHEVQCTWKY